MGGGPSDLLGRLGLTPPGQVAIMVTATVAFLPVPDADLFLLRLLHHRSILTHSVLPAVLVWWLLGRELGPAAAAGAALGVAIHLAADVLSPSRGFGRVWLPEPFQVSLGGWSRLWLLGNALLASALAAAVLPPGAGWRRLALLTGAAAALSYGLVNERSVVAALFCLLVVAAGHWGARSLLEP